MKALVLALAIAFSGTIASASCANSQAGLLDNTNGTKENKTRTLQNPNGSGTKVDSSNGAGSTT